MIIMVVIPLIDGLNNTIDGIAPSVLVVIPPIIIGHEPLSTIIHNQLTMNLTIELVRCHDHGSVIILHQPN